MNGEETMTAEQSPFRLRGTMCTGSEEKVDGLKLIESVTDSENLYALVSPAFASQLLQAVNSHAKLVEALRTAKLTITALYSDLFVLDGNDDVERVYTTWETVDQIDAALAECSTTVD